MVMRELTKEAWDSYDWRKRVEIANNQAHVCVPDWDDLEFLYDTVKRDKPYSILEFGCGMSTIVMAKALEELEGLRSLVALENDPWFFMGFGTFFRLYHKEADVVFSAISNRHPMFIHYEWCPVNSAELVYVDGPMLLNNYKIVDNFMDLLPYPKKFVVDGRTDQVAFMRTMLGSMYEIELYQKGARTVFTKLDQPRG